MAHVIKDQQLKKLIVSDRKIVPMHTIKVVERTSWKTRSSVKPVPVHMPRNLNKSEKVTKAEEVF